MDGGARRSARAGAGCRVRRARSGAPYLQVHVKSHRPYSRWRFRPATSRSRLRGRIFLPRILPGKTFRIEPLNRSSRRKEALTSFPPRSVSLLTSAATRLKGRENSPVPEPTPDVSAVGLPPHPNPLPRWGRGRRPGAVSCTRLPSNSARKFEVFGVFGTFGVFGVFGANTSLPIPASSFL